MITGLFGPLGCGKTVGLCQKAYLYAQAFPGAKVLIARDTYPNLTSTTMATFFEWFPPGQVGEYHKTEKRYTLWTEGKPSEILFRALDDEKDIRNVLSLEVAAAAVDEPQGGPTAKGGHDPGIDENLYRSILGRIGRQKGYTLKMLWMGGNPPAPSHWIAKEFEYPGVGQPRTDHPKRQLYLATRDENRANLHPTYYEDLLELWGAGTPLARRFIDGEWVEFATEQPFHREWIRYWGTDDEPLPPIEELAVEAGFDPAISTNDRAAKSALVIAGQARRGLNRGRIYVLDAAAGHWTVLEQVEHLIAAVRRWKIRRLRIEDVAYQKALGDILDREARQAGVAVNVDLVRPDMDKLRRANAWSALVESEAVLFGPGQRELIDAMLSVPGDRTKWDLVDAASLCVRGFPPLPAESQSITQPEVDAMARAAGYAVKIERPGPPRPAPPRSTASVLRDLVPGARDSGMRRAAGYSVRIGGRRA